MKRIAICAAVLAALGLAGCGDVGDDGSSAELETRLQQLPEDPELRATALEKLTAEFPDAPQVAQAMREFEAAQTAGEIRTVQFEGERELTFTLFEETAHLVESGPRGQPSILADRGLSEQPPAEIWRQLLPDEPVPQVLLDLEQAAADTTIEADDIASDAAHEAVLGAAGNGAPQPVATPTESGEVGVSAQAYSVSPDHFTWLGGCEPRPARGASQYTNLLDAYCHDDIWTGNGLWTAHYSGQARWRVDSVGRVSGSGSTGFYVYIYRNGSLTQPVWVPLGRWVNVAAFAHTTPQPRYCCSHCFWGCCAWCTQPNKLDIDYHRLEVRSATGDKMRVGGVYFNSLDSRTDTQPWGY